MLRLAGPLAAAPQSGDLLWQIGNADHNSAEFALAPDGFARFKEDPVFVVGESDPKRDWPYVQPGPSDAWAGQRQHTFTILFGLKSAPAPGDCRLRCEMLDTQGGAPPHLRISVNGRAFEQVLGPGAGDESIHGQPNKGKPSTFVIKFPSNLLRLGDNHVQITTVSGCWLLYDWLGLETPTGAVLDKARTQTIVETVEPFEALVIRNGKSLQPIRVTLRHLRGDSAGFLRVEGAEPQPLRLTSGVQTVEALAPAASSSRQTKITVELGGRVLASESVTLQPVRKLTVYVLPHSHTDIGYTEIQTAIETKQVNNLLEGIAAAKRTANYPAGARFVWNVEVLWAADLYLHRLNEQQRGDFFAAVKAGQVALNGMYLNELTGLCRPEELLQLFRYSTTLSRQCGVTIDSTMISDVPGYTWGSVTAMAQAGIKYFSTAPNYFDRIGDILVQWENKPFYWVGPSGKDKVLVWIPFKGYATSHIYQQLSPEFVHEYQAALAKAAYPYDIAYLRWSGHGDNAVPDPEICEFIKDWNSRYAYPKFIISSTSEAFRAFEQRYGSQLPKVRGDWTPYWEDGAASSALETAMNRATSDRLTQAETLWAMLHPSAFPQGAFEDAWRNVLLYSEHTWGASMSVSDPENPKTKEQWEIKRSYAVQAETQSRQLVERALGRSSGQSSADIEVFNTTSWPRTELVTVPKAPSTGEGVADAAGKLVLAQRLASGELVFVARKVPPFGSSRYHLVGSPGGFSEFFEPATAQGAVLDNGLLHVRLDERTGGIVELRARGIDANFADVSSGHALNDYLYLPGDQLTDLKGNDPVKISVKERGPLVASLLIESGAPGCRKLTREIRLVAGLDSVELLDLVDKERAPISPKRGNNQFAQKGGKESVNFAFPFNVPQGEMLLDLPLGAMRPELDQLPSGCKNWFTVGRWVDVSNRDYGITWVTLDAPLIEVGGITATMLGSQTNPKVWRNKVERTQTLYSWAMNNHWGTNYRAYQEGPVLFRFRLRPHRKSAPDANSRFATALSQPLIVAPAREAASLHSLLHVEAEGALVTALKPSDDGRAVIVRLFGASGKDSRVKLTWAKPEPKHIWLSDTSEQPLREVKGAIAVPAWEVVTLRAEQGNLASQP